MERKTRKRRKARVNLIVHTIIIAVIYSLAAYALIYYKAILNTDMRAITTLAIVAVGAFMVIALPLILGNKQSRRVEKIYEKEGKKH